MRLCLFSLLALPVLAIKPLPISPLPQAELAEMMARMWHYGSNDAGSVHQPTDVPEKFVRDEDTKASHPSESLGLPPSSIPTKNNNAHIIVVVADESARLYGHLSRIPVTKTDDPLRMEIHGAVINSPSKAKPTDRDHAGRNTEKNSATGKNSSDSVHTNSIPDTEQPVPKPFKKFYLDRIMELPLYERIKVFQGRRSLDAKGTTELDILERIGNFFFGCIRPK